MKTVNQDTVPATPEVLCDDAVELILKSFIEDGIKSRQELTDIQLVSKQFRRCCPAESWSLLQYRTASVKDAKVSEQLENSSLRSSHVVENYGKYQSFFFKLLLDSFYLVHGIDREGNTSVVTPTRFQPEDVRTKIVEKMRENFFRELPLAVQQNRDAIAEASAQIQYRKMLKAFLGYFKPAGKWPHPGITKLLLQLITNEIGAEVKQGVEQTGAAWLHATFANDHAQNWYELDKDIGDQLSAIYQNAEEDIAHNRNRSANPAPLLTGIPPLRLE